MKLSVGALLALSVVLSLSACQIQPDMRQMQEKNRKLNGDLQEAKADIEKLNQQQTKLQKDIRELSRVNSVLDTEKSSRVQESSELRSEIRRFVQRQIDAYKDFLVQGGLLDYVGGELVERSHVEDKPLLLVDLANPVSGSGTLTSVGAFFVKPGSFSVKVLRPVEDELVVIWDSKPLQVTETGINRINFPVSVVVEKGDIIAYHFDQGVAVGFDEGTGDTRYQSDPVKLGESIDISSLDGEKRHRAYSLGVYGLLN